MSTLLKNLKSMLGSKSKKEKEDLKRFIYMLSNPHLYPTKHTNNKCCPNFPDIKRPVRQNNIIDILTKIAKEMHHEL